MVLIFICYKSSLVIKIIIKLISFSSPNLVRFHVLRPSAKSPFNWWRYPFSH